MDPQEELVRLRIIELRRRLPSQTELILELHKAGFATTRIAELLGTTANTVNVTVHKAKKRNQAKKGTE